jgi:hypothetical protein
MKNPRPGDILEMDDHRWRVRGVHLGAIGVESLIEIEKHQSQTWLDRGMGNASGDVCAGDTAAPSKSYSL